LHLSVSDDLRATGCGDPSWRRLAGRWPTGQRNLSLSYAGVGAVLVTQGRLEDALKSYRESGALTERLAPLADCLAPPARRRPYRSRSRECRQLGVRVRAGPRFREGAGVG